MNISKYMRPDLVFLDLNGRDKDDLFAKIVQGMAACHVLKQPAAFLDEILQRETQAPTAIGRGIALPHTRTLFVKKPVIAFARVRPPISFATHPEEKVELVFLMGTPKDDPNIYLQILGHLCKRLRKPNFRESLLEATSPAEILALLSCKPEFA